MSHPFAADEPWPCISTGQLVLCTACREVAESLWRCSRGRAARRRRRWRRRILFQSGLSCGSSTTAALLSHVRRSVASDAWDVKPSSVSALTLPLSITFFRLAWLNFQLLSWPSSPWRAERRGFLFALLSLQPEHKQHRLTPNPSCSFHCLEVVSGKRRD